MSALGRIPGVVDLLHKKLVVERKTYEAVSYDLKMSYPNLDRGLGARGIRRFCKEHNIHGTLRINDAQLDLAVACSIAQVNWERTYLLLVTFFLFSHHNATHTH